MSEPVPDRRGALPSDHTCEHAAVRPSSRTRLNEDWAATIVGLVLLALVLLGVIPGWLVP